MIGVDTARETPSIRLSERFIVLLHAFLFVLGFSVVFIVGWGGAVTAVGQLFGAYKTILGRLGGIVVILFGLATLGVVRVPWFYADTRPEYQGRAGTFANSALMGLLFAAGWSPCIGATLGAILTMGLSESTVWQAMWLASGYSLGLGIPFLILALLLERSTGLIRRLRRYQRIFQIVSGLFIIAIGILLVGNLMTRIAIWAFQHRFYIDASVSYSAAPTYLTAMAAGLLSFLSPCVLPLVPAYLGYLSGHTLWTARLSA